MDTGYLIAVDRRTLEGRERDVIVAYEEKPDGVVFITIHPCVKEKKLVG